MDEQMATTLAAVIAALASLLSLTLNLSASRRAEMRAAHREVIAPLMPELSEDIHTIVAGIVVMRRRIARGSDVSNWQTKAKEAGQRVDTVRRRTLFLLEGLDQPLRQLALASDHVATYKNIPGSNVEDLLKAYQALADDVSKALARSYRTGLPPGMFAKWCLDVRSKRVIKLWESRPSRGS